MFFGSCSLESMAVLVGSLLRLILKHNTPCNVLSFFFHLGKAPSVVSFGLMSFFPPNHGETFLIKFPLGNSNFVWLVKADETDAKGQA